MTLSREETDTLLCRLLFGDGTLRKAFLTVLIVGTVVTLILQCHSFLSGEFPPLWKVLLTFSLAAWGAFTAIRTQIRRRQPASVPAATEKVLQQ